MKNYELRIMNYELGECCVVDAASLPRLSGGVDFVDGVDGVEDELMPCGRDR